MKWYSFATIMDQEFEFDRAKSAANREKHGIDFVAAQALWKVFGVSGRLPFPLEERWLRLARLGGRTWGAVFTTRDGRIRLISVRRARRDEEELYENAAREAGEHDREP